MRNDAIRLRVNSRIIVDESGPSIGGAVAGGVDDARRAEGGEAGAGHARRRLGAHGSTVDLRPPMRRRAGYSHQTRTRTGGAMTETVDTETLDTERPDVDIVLLAYDLRHVRGHAGLVRLRSCPAEHCE